MKKICFTLFLLFTASMIIAQSPQAFKYQAIARDEAGNVLSVWDISLRVSLIQEGADGQAIYTETHKVQTNIYGLINLIIGEGEVVNGDFSSIKWSENRHYIKIEMDIEGGSDYKEIGISQLYAVPYALYAEQAGNLVQSGAKDPAQDQQSLQKKTKSTVGTRNGTPNCKLSADADSWLNANSGNVGIGTTAPGEKLEVDGNIKANGIFLSEAGLIFLDSYGNPQQIVSNPDGTLSFKFICRGRMKDIRDDRQYNIIKIGRQCWMAENLNIGTKINTTAPGQNDNGIIEKYCYDNDTAQCDIYGGLYEWDECMEYESTKGVQGVCPGGWHIPTDEEWKILEGTVDSQHPVGDSEWDGINWRGFDAGLNLKFTSGWSSGGNGPDLFGFSALPGGYRYSNDDFYDQIAGTYFWSSTENGGNAWKRSLYYDRSDVHRGSPNKDRGFSVRCLKDHECGDTITDSRDGQNYGTVKIGDQCWMVQNLNIGTMIDGVEDPIEDSNIDKYCYNNESDSCDTYGGLYQWNEAMGWVTDGGAQGICPDGWHIPTDEEWKILEGTVDSQYGVGDPEWDGTSWRGLDAGGHLKETGTTHWNSPDTGATDYYGFTALPGGFRTSFNGSFCHIGNYGYFWSSSEAGTLYAWFRSLYHNYDGVNRYDDYKTTGFSVRCLQDGD